MPTDPNLLELRDFDMEATRNASLRATLSRVRLRRRARRAAGASAALLAVAAAAWLTMPGTDSARGPHLSQSSVVIRSIPLTAEQRVVSTGKPELFFRTPAEPVATMRVATPPDAVVPRLGEAEFHNWLAANELYCLQVGGDLPQVRPLQPQ